MKSLPNCSTCEVIGLHCLKHSGCRLREQAAPPKWSKLRDPSEGWVPGSLSNCCRKNLLPLWRSSVHGRVGEISPQRQSKREVSYHQLCALHFLFSPHFAQSRHICFHIRSIRKEKRSQVRACFCSSSKQCCSLVLCTHTPHTGGHPCCLCQSCHAFEDFGCEEETQSSRFLFTVTQRHSLLSFCPFLITPCSNRRGHKSALQTCTTLQDHGVGLRSSSKLTTKLQKKSHPFRTFSPQLL